MGETRVGSRGTRRGGRHRTGVGYRASDQGVIGGYVAYRAGACGGGGASAWTAGRRDDGWGSHDRWGHDGWRHEWRRDERRGHERWRRDERRRHERWRDA